jgi:hypothetical protein
VALHGLDEKALFVPAALYFDGDIDGQYGGKGRFLGGTCEKRICQKDEKDQDNQDFEQFKDDKNGQDSHEKENFEIHENQQRDQDR